MAAATANLGPAAAAVVTSTTVTPLMSAGPTRTTVAAVGAAASHRPGVGHRGLGVDSQDPIPCTQPAGRHPLGRNGDRNQDPAGARLTIRLDHALGEEHPGCQAGGSHLTDHRVPVSSGKDSDSRIHRDPGDREVVRGHDLAVGHISADGEDLLPLTRGANEPDHGQRPNRSQEGSETQQPWTSATADRREPSPRALRADCAGPCGGISRAGGTDRRGRGGHGCSPGLSVGGRGRQ